jgi:WD40 repeat protein
MSDQRPRFQLQDVYQDGPPGEPQLYELKDVQLEWSLDRRGFLAAAAVGTVLLSGIHWPLQAAPSRTKSKPPPLIQAHTSAVKGLAFGGGGSLLASASTDKTLKIWDLPPGKLHKTQTGKDPVLCLTMSADGALVLSGDADHSITARRLPEAILDRTLRVWAPAVTCLASSAGAIPLWDAGSGKLLRTLTGHRREVTDVAFSPDGALLASGSEDNTGGVWDVASGKRLHTLRHEGATVGAVAFAADGRRLFTGGADEAIRIWDLPGATAGPVIRAHGARVGTLRLRPDGRRLVSGGWDGAIKLWEPATGRLLQTLSGHTGPVNCLAFTPDGRILVSGGDDGTIRIWDGESGELITHLYDPATLGKDQEAVQYNWTNQFGWTLTYTLPCGSPVPAGAVCTCNCVPGIMVVPVPTHSSGGSYCSCVPVCTCVPIK